MTIALSLVRRRLRLTLVSSLLLIGFSPLGRTPPAHAQEAPADAGVDNGGAASPKPETATTEIPAADDGGLAVGALDAQPSVVAAGTAAPAPAAEPAVAPAIVPIVEPASHPPASPPGEPQALGAVTVTGVRSSQPRSVADSPVPVDVIAPDQLEATGHAGLKEILGNIVPSLTMPAQGGGGTSASVRPISIRGLSGDYLLVLVNGKRRHTTSLINNLSRISGGSTPVDIDLIPTNAVGQIEVLRDGAAAQYGSDAISGVINIILDRAPEGGSFTSTAGATYTQGAPLIQQSLGYGLRLGNQGGFLRLSAEAKYHGASDSSASPLPATKANGQPNYYYPPLAPGVPDPREASVTNYVFAGGYGRSNRDAIVNTSYNAELPLGDRLTLYSFATVSYRDIKDARGAFAANNIASLPEIYPRGFQAYRRIWEWDYQPTAGLRANIATWDWDLSSSFGRDHVRLGAENTLNPSIGPTSPTSFRMGKQIQDLWVNNLDAHRAFDVGLADKLETSFGFEHRWERFRNKAGEPDSYRDGGYVIPIDSDPFHQAPLPGGIGGYGGLSPSPGLSSFTGTSPADARVLSRNNLAAYGDLSTKPLKDWFVGLAGRAEHYDDSAGNTVSGKVSSRYEIVKGLALRGGVNSGFRAPSLAQTGFSTTQNTVTVIGSERVSTTSKFLPVDSPAALALGAKPLKPERSLNYTAGITFEAAKALRLTVDAYQIRIDDRIVKTEFLGTSNNGGAAIKNILVANGITGVDSAQFFTNAIDTRTRGIDVVAEYTLRTAAVGQLRANAAYSYNKTKILHVIDNPAPLSTLNVVLFGRQAQRDLVLATPRDKLVLNGDWSIGRLHTDLRFTRFGKYVESSTTTTGDQYFGAKWITDLDIGVDLNDSVTLAVGANNLFNVYPDKHGVVSAIDGSGQYGSFAPFGLTGGFYYAQVASTF